MADAPAPSPPSAEESVRNRPYRRFVGSLFALIILAITVTVMRGIISRLDRLPSVDNLERPETVDLRALRACAEDFSKLEQKTRVEAGRALSAPPDQAPAIWQRALGELELERLHIVARCRLNDSSDDRVVSDLAEAADGVEQLLRSYNLLFDRHAQDGLPASREVEAATRRALKALETR